MSEISKFWTVYRYEDTKECGFWRYKFIMRINDYNSSSTKT